MGKLIVDLYESNQPLLVGGKAASLGRLLAEGFNVPPGFVITESATELPEKEILNKFDMLDTKFVAVRSSAVNEDSNNASWAGQLETFLNVERSNLIEAIRKCQVSAQTKRAKSYAEHNNLSSGGVAVLVQKMVQSEVSGVAFSVHPVSRDPSQIVIEAVVGLGESLVSGKVTPDTYITSKANHTVEQHFIGKQTRQLVQSPEGGNEWKDITVPTQKMTDAQISKLSALVEQLEVYYGFPVDIEWAQQKSELYVVQARPITTLT